MRLNKKGFTLIELLVVIGILAILATVAVLVINPAELFRGARDSKRLSELTTLNKALQIVEITIPNASFGTANVVYVSLPDTSPTCATYSLPSLPSGWSYNCANSANFRKTNGTGWVPVNFDAVPITSLSVLPVDPVNNVGNYYTYVTGGSWALSTLFESERYAEQAATDGGPDPAQYEVGTDLTIAPFVRGMVGYWKFDELSGPFLEDSSGNNTGTANGGAVFGSVGKVGRAVTFDGVNDYITMGNNSSLFPSSKIAIAFWTRLSLLPNGVADFTQHVAGGGSNVFIRTTSGNKINFSLIDGVGWKGVTSNTILTQNQWYHVVGNYDGGSIKIYINGVSENTFPASGNINKGIPFNYFNISGATGGTTARITGLIDDLRLYNRALTNSEIQAMYNATK